MSLGRRFEIIGRWAIINDRPSLLNLSCQLLRQLLSDGAAREVTVDFAGFIECLLRSETQKRQHKDIVKTLTQTICESIGESSDLDTVQRWGEFIKEWRPELSFVD